MTLSVTVVQDGQKDRTLQCPGMLFVVHEGMLVYMQVESVLSNVYIYVFFLGGTNLRKLLVGNGINVYRSITRWTNCSGKQRCGTCIVDVRKFNVTYNSDV